MNHRPTFAIIGLGYIAPRHLQAIKDVGGELIAALEWHDTGGILDRYFINARFFKDDLKFMAYIKRKAVDYVVVCTPNGYHFNHIMMGIEAGAKVICEKPLCISSQQIRALLQYNERIFCIMQLRLHPKRAQMALTPHTRNKLHNMLYFTPRGHWYSQSWKSHKKHGGLLLNIGVHMFDLLQLEYGKPVEYSQIKVEKNKATGRILFDDCAVGFYLSTEPYKKPKRIMMIDEEIISFDGFTELHTECYKKIMSGDGVHPADCLASVMMVEELQQNIQK